MSDHLPSFTCLNTHVELNGPPKYVQVETIDKNSIQSFCTHLNGKNILLNLDRELNSDPNKNYETLENTILCAKEKYLPKRTVKFHKYKHKFTPWITAGILRSIKYRDTLYRQLRSTRLETPEFYIIKQNLKTYNTILRRNIRE